MKNILKLICAICAISTLHANEDLLELYELNKLHSESVSSIGEYSRFCKTELFKLKVNTDILTTRVANRNTFLWYVWNDVDCSEGEIRKFRILKNISNLTIKPKRK